VADHAHRRFPGPEPLVLVLPGGARFPVRDAMTIGRADDATIRLDDQTVSRLHARITVGKDGPMIEDAGSRFGVTVSGQRLSEPRRLIPGQEIRLGNVVLRVVSAAPSPRIVPDVTALTPNPGRSALPEGRHTSGDARNATIVVPVGATQMGLRPAVSPSRDGSIRPRLRSGWALKRIDGDPGEERYVLRDLRDGSFLRLDKEDAQLLELLDGNRTIVELLADADQLLGQSAAGRLARLIADLGERGMLTGVAPTPRPYSEPGFLARAFKSRERTYDWLPRYFHAAYRHWGRLFFSPLAFSGLMLLSLVGVIVFSYLVGARYGTPLVVAHHLVIGGAVFIVGRIAIAAIHELAHGLALAHYGRTTRRAGLRLVLIFPYAFVDTSEAYFEPRPRRIVISAAGPVSDFSLGALFGILCAVSPRGNVRDVFFQLAFAAYVGALFNINPFLDRDGYQILCDWLREPKLKERARRQLRERLSGQTSTEPASPVLARYAVAGLVWTVIGAGFVAVLMSRYYHRLSVYAPHGLLVAAFILAFVVLLLPIPIALGVPLIHRARYGAPEVNRVIE
jgi:putative peptide zinc metalloprotease protein